jgi:hypothetical protein
MNLSAASPSPLGIASVILDPPFEIMDGATATGFDTIRVAP